MSHQIFKCVTCHSSLCRALSIDLAVREIEEYSILWISEELLFRNFHCTKWNEAWLCPCTFCVWLLMKQVLLCVFRRRDKGMQWNCVSCRGQSVQSGRTVMYSKWKRCSSAALLFTLDYYWLYICLRMWNR